MMVEYRGEIIIDSCFSDDEKHRFYLRRTYSTTRVKEHKNPRKQVFILINPSYSDELIFDKTNRIASNIAVDDGYYEAVILNLYSLITKDAKTKTLNKQLTEANHPNHDEIIRNEVRNADRVIIAWGMDEKYNDRKEEVKRILQDEGLTSNEVFSIRKEIKTKNQVKVLEPAHLSRYISDRPRNFKLIPFMFPDRIG